MKDFIEDTCGKIVHKSVSQSLSLIISMGSIFRRLYKILRCLNMFDIAIVLICVHNIVYIIDTRFTCTHLSTSLGPYQVAEIKRAVFRALTRLRAATIKVGQRDVETTRGGGREAHHGNPIQSYPYRRCCKPLRLRHVKAIIFTWGCIGIACMI